MKRELVFRPPDGASCPVAYDALGPSPTRSEPGPTVPAQVIRVAATAEQRFLDIWRTMLGGAEWGARDLQRHSRHGATLSWPRELIFAHYALVAVRLALYPILENTCRFGQQTND